MIHNAGCLAVMLMLVGVTTGGVFITADAQDQSPQTQSPDTADQILERGVPGLPGVPPPRGALAITPCCGIAGIDARLGVVTAKETATGRSFEFKVPDAALLNTLKIGQPVYANLQTKQVSFDGATTCCTILTITNPLQAPGPHSALPQGSTGFTLPTVSAGVPHPKGPVLRQSPTRWESRTVPAVVAGRTLNAEVLHLRGLDGIEQAQGLPEGAKNLLLMHVKTLPPGDSDHYIVNKKLAEEWMKSHPAPASAKPPASGGGGHSGCGSFSWHCAGEAAKHAADEVSKQAEELRKKATDEWNRVANEAAHDWKMAEACFADQTLRLSNIPIQFSVLPEFPLSFERQGSRDLSHGSASGKVKGTVSVGVPVEADVHAQVDMLYIPCLPFAVRPKSLGANGTMTVGSRLSATVNATGQFDELFTIPPGGYPQIVIYVIPIVIGDVPVAELDVSVYLDGTVSVSGEGNLDGHLKLDARQKTAFDFDCSGKGCHLHAHDFPVPVTTTETSKSTGAST